MTDADIDREFRRLVDAFIQQANQQADRAARETVGMALLYAAARYNAFVVSTHAPDAEKYEADRPQAIEFFAREYQRMLQENLDDYRKVYDENFKYAHLMKQP